MKIAVLGTGEGCWLRAANSPSQATTSGKPATRRPYPRPEP